MTRPRALPPGALLTLLALLFFGSGVSALASEFLLQHLQRPYTTIYPQLPDSFSVLTLVRLAISVGPLAVPTTLMGATLPLA